MDRGEGHGKGKASPRPAAGSGLGQKLPRIQTSGSRTEESAGGHGRGKASPGGVDQDRSSPEFRQVQAGLGSLLSVPEPLHFHHHNSVTAILQVSPTGL